MAIKMLLHDFLLRAERYHATRPAWSSAAGVVTYAAFTARARAAAAGLAGRGVTIGARVAILAENGPFFIEAYYACSLAGAIAVPINIRLAAAEVAAILEDSGCALAFHDAAGRDLTFAAAKCPCLDAEAGWEDLCATVAPLPDITAVGEDDVVHICYTGGTTGRAKGVMLTHRNVVTSSLNKIVLGGFQRDDVWLHAAPMFHQADSWACFSFTALGARHVFMPRFNAADAVDLIRDHGVTAFQLVPTMIVMMLETPNLAGDRVTSVRRVLYGSAPMPPETLQRCVAVFGPVFQHIYGLTEAAGTVAATPWPPAASETEGERMKSCGQPIAGVDMKITGGDGDEQPPGAVGNIRVRGANIMKGYWNRADETARVLADGWLDTGDLGYMDAGGFVFIVDRAKDMIITGGENVYSTEVENALAAHGDVLHVAVVGLPDQKWGEAVTAFVELRPGAAADEAAIIQHCRQRIAAYKCPKRVIFRDSLPKSGAGKILKNELRDAAGSIC
jgi:long-chain acyl-CoA synthetase